MREEKEEDEFSKLGEDKNGRVFEKCDMVDIEGHPNPEVNGTNYIVLRRWVIGHDKYECIKEENGIVKHIVAERLHIKKVKK